jgi:hypothetical protein
LFFPPNDLSGLPALLFFMRGTSFNPLFSRGFLTGERKSPRVYKKKKRARGFLDRKKIALLSIKQKGGAIKN